jgi:uncharacterized protein (DUF2461 family)
MVNVWQISPGREERGLWPEFKKSNIIAIGWDRLGDLKKYTTDKDIENALKRHYPDSYPRDTYPVNDINSIKIFYQSIKKRDIIVAKKGATKEVYGVGKVTDEYYFDESRETFKHVIGVNWVIGFDGRVTVRTSKRFLQPTAGDLKRVRFVEVMDSLLAQFPNLVGAFEKLEDGNEDQVEMEIDEKTYNRIWKLLQAKKQIVLYGPPGTGKTWITKKFVKTYLKKNPPNIKSLGKEAFTFKDLSFQSFTKGTFDFLRDLENNNTKTWMDANRDRFRKFVDEPLRSITTVIGRDCIARLDQGFETTPDGQHTISRINKNVFGKKKDIYWPHMWSAFYRKIIGDKRKDSQLFILVNKEELRCGFCFGNLKEAKDLEEKFKENVSAELDFFFGMLKDMEILNDFDFEFTDSTTNKRVKTKVATKEELQQWLEKDALHITRSFKPQEVAQQTTDQIVNSIAESFTKLYPVYLFATSDTPMAKVEEYLEGTEEGEPDIERFVRFVSFHQSYSYEEFVEGIRPVITDTTVGKQTGKDYEISKGIFKRICEDAKGDRDNNYFLIVDEINRGQISKIFGELITLLEKDKRLSPTGDLQENTIVLDLVYSKEPFAVPWNLYIIGTMNTADKSIALVDVALRRRFGFIEIPSEPSKLKVYTIQGISVDLPKILENINRKITVLVDRDHQIGHSYLMNIDKDAKGNTISDEKQILENLRYAFYNEIIPLLQEYFYNDWEKLAQVISPFVKTILTLEKAMEEMENATQGIYEIADDLDDPAFLKALSEL